MQKSDQFKVALVCDTLMDAYMYEVSSLPILRYGVVQINLALLDCFSF